MNMQSDWNLLRPEQELNEGQKSLVRRIVEPFLITGKGIPGHQMKAELGKDRHLLNELIQFRLIRNNTNQFYPTFEALFFVQDSSLSDGYVRTLDLILRATKNLYTSVSSPRPFRFQEIEERVKELLSSTKSAAPVSRVNFSASLRIASFFLKDFPHYLHIHEYQYPDSPVISVIGTENLFDYENLQKAWECELAQRPKPVPIMTAAEHPKAASHPEVGETVFEAGKRTRWQEIEELGEGGQSVVFLVRVPKRLKERTDSIETIHSFSPWQAAQADQRAVLTGRFAEAVMRYARSESSSELGAMKVFKLGEKEDEKQARSRLSLEIKVLQENRQGLPKLLDFNETEGWLVTEYFPQRTIEFQNTKYRGNAVAALKAFRSLVQTVVLLHKDGYVHRDIKAANVFVRGDEELVLGDFGIVYAPNANDRLTHTLERVGPRDYIPQWANLGARLENVTTKFDVYMLGKLLWSMVDGRAVLPREYQRSPDHDFDLTQTFRNNPQIHFINQILDKCVVETERQCIDSQELLLMVDKILEVMERGGQSLKDGIPRPCRVCGQGFYQREEFLHHQPPVPKNKPTSLRFWFGGDNTHLQVQPFVCDYCGHVELFKSH